MSRLPGPLQAPYMPNITLTPDSDSGSGSEGEEPEEQLPQGISLGRRRLANAGADVAGAMFANCSQLPTPWVEGGMVISLPKFVALSAAPVDKYSITVPKTLKETLASPQTQKLAMHVGLGWG